MVISIDISGPLERRLRRLVELGAYPSAAEAVREAVRIFLERYDLRELALQTYLSREASLHYVAELAGTSIEGMIDYMLSKGVLPLLGALREDDLTVLEGKVLLDPSALFVTYRSFLHRLLPSVPARLVLPKQLVPTAQVMEAKMVRLGIPVKSRWEQLEVELEEEGDDNFSPLERSVLERAKELGLVVLSDDVRVRERARREGLRAYASLSLALTAERRGELKDVRELLMSLKAVPSLVPPELEERWTRLER
ncbi:MAG: hypothetical protein NZ902_03890 [Acidilobaceae archaeon]|nr:hypothetical protein [Acidilobaceae archaeon]MCX8165129.1 hypothetical protein [Acidilobaceae archaeon]MDW7974355.1 hypothetical protein [Sulfolobales archaeon]